MRNFIIIAAIAAGAWYFLGAAGPVGAYADNGTPLTLLFTTEKCGPACNDTRRFLKRRAEFEEYDAFDNVLGRKLYETYGGTGYLPYVVIGQQRVEGHDPGGVISAIAAEFGPDRVKPAERRALQRNFDREGEPRVVMYATAWCGYCQKAREYFVANKISYVEFDIEKDRAAHRDYEALRGSGTPLLYHGYARLSGFNASRMESDLGL